MLLTSVLMYRQPAHYIKQNRPKKSKKLFFGQYLFTHPCEGHPHILPLLNPPNKPDINISCQNCGKGKGDSYTQKILCFYIFAVFSQNAYGGDIG